jgi:hypothetical protein
MICIVKVANTTNLANVVAIIAESQTVWSGLKFTNGGIIEMNDRFKFRVWDKQEITDRMIYLTSEHLQERQGNLQDYLYSDRFIPMQSTGIKDKNGKLIFEGDIVKHDNGLLNEIRWCQPLSQFVRSYYGANEDLFYDGDKNMEIEVIGNRFENPELLEGGK